MTHWKELLSDFSSINEEKIDSVPYQFLHRSASACYQNQGQAVVIYQLFYDNDTKEKLQDYIDKLSDAVRAIRPSENLKYYVWQMKAKGNFDEAEAITPALLGPVTFQLMKKKVMYRFPNAQGKFSALPQ